MFVNRKIQVLWCITTYQFANSYQPTGGAFSLHFQGLCSPWIATREDILYW
jgi:hypothetical protein